VIADTTGLSSVDAEAFSAANALEVYAEKNVFSNPSHLARAVAGVSRCVIIPVRSGHRAKQTAQILCAAVEARVRLVTVLSLQRFDSSRLDEEFSAVEDEVKAVLAAFREASMASVAAIVFPPPTPTSSPPRARGPATNINVIRTGPYMENLLYFSSDLFKSNLVRLPLVDSKRCWRPVAAADVATALKEMLTAPERDLNSFNDQIYVFSGTSSCLLHASKKCFS
jgi:uncharacterized protein YbjT (DUF2867 family)